MADSRKRYAVVGLGSRSHMFTKALAGTYKDRAELVAFCDVNRTRMAYWNAQLAKSVGFAGAAMYTPDQFDQMLRENRIDTVVVTTIDRAHHRYIIRAMELGCDAISEKPMTVDAEKCDAVLDAINRTGRKLTVTFNYRYAPRNSKVKELLLSGVIGEVLSVHFEWLLDTRHGADYFRRWHRDKRNSGGLMVHKATHHFDLVNWWLAARPVTVFGMGDLRFYGRENAEQRGVSRFYERVHGSSAAANDPFALHLERDAQLTGLYLNAEHEDGYLRDQSVFGHNISIEDDMGVMVRYDNKAVMTYHLTAYSPWEGYRIAFNGTRGRLEYDVEERSYVSGDAADHHQPVGVVDPSATPADLREPARILVRPMWEKPQEVSVAMHGEGGHGGGDTRLLSDIFGEPQSDPLGRAANHIDGALSILTGIAANRSFATGLPVDVRSLLSQPLPRLGR